MGAQQGHTEPTELIQECVHEHEGSLEVMPIQHENEAQNEPELRAVHPSLWVELLAYDGARHVQGALLPHKSQEDRQDLLAIDNLQQRPAGGDCA